MSITIYPTFSIPFDLGQTVATPHVLEVVPRAEIFVALRRHQNCDWGDVSPQDKWANDRAVKDGERLLSVYHSEDGIKFWIITEWDRSATTVLLPEDY